MHGGPPLSELKGFAADTCRGGRRAAAPRGYRRARNIPHPATEGFRRRMPGRKERAEFQKRARFQHVETVSSVLPTIMKTKISVFVNPFQFSVSARLFRGAIKPAETGRTGWDNIGIIGGQSRWNRRQLRRWTAFSADRLQEPLETPAHRGTGVYGSCAFFSEWFPRWKFTLLKKPSD